MNRLKFMLLLGCILLQACGSPALDETPDTTTVSLVQPSSSPTHGAPPPTMTKITELTETPIDQTAQKLYIACGVENAAGLCEIKIGE